MKNAGRDSLYLCKISSTKFDLESNWNILNEKCRPEFPIFCKISSTKFDLESNWNILNEKRRPEFPIYLQTFLNEIRFRIKLKNSEWKTQARLSYIFANFSRRNSISSQIENFWMKKAGQKFLQTFLNEIRFRIKLKHSEWKRQARYSYIFANSLQRNSI